MTKRPINVYAYGHEQLHRAVSYLATQDGTPAQCLESVAVDHLCHITPENDLPEELRPEFIEIMERLGKVWGTTSEEEGALVRGVRTMNDYEVRSTIRTVVYLYGRVCEELGRDRKR